MSHVPVLLSESIDVLDLHPGDQVIDAILGLGGHAANFLKRILPQGRLIGFEQDERNLDVAKTNLVEFSESTIFVHDNFCHLKKRLLDLGIDSFDKVFFDLGLSSPHVDDAARGFSFMKSGALDMRFDQRNVLTAEQVVNTYTEEKLVDIFFRLGEEKFARRIARAIVNKRLNSPIKDTVELGQIVKMAVPFSTKKTHPATKVFQAIRMEVNDELPVLESSLAQAFEMLKVGGVMAVITYHSLEDRMVKRFFQKLERPDLTDPEKMLFQSYDDPYITKISSKPIQPAEVELSSNARARSAKLRAVKKIR